MNPNIILSGRQPNVVNALAQGTQAASMVNQVKHENALRNLYREQGQGIMQGDPAALNSLAQLDPMAGRQIVRQNAADARADEHLQLARQAGARAAAQFASDQAKAEQARREAETLKSLTPYFIQGQNTGDMRPFNQMAAEHGVTAEQFPVMLATSEGVLAELGKSYLGVGGGKTEADREIARLVGIGTPEDYAIKLKEGAIKSATDPVTGETRFYDMTTNPPTLLGADVSNNDTPAPEPVATQGPPAPNARQAFGMEGAAKAVVNAVSDAAGQGQVFPEAAKASADFKVLRENLTNLIASTYGRQPPSWLLQQIQDLTPDPNRPLQGPDGALSKLEALSRALAQEGANLDEQIGGRMRESDRAVIRARLSAVQSAIGQVENAAARLRPNEIQLSPEVENRLKAYE